MPNEYKCNVCEAVVKTDEKCLDLLKHITASHPELHELHKENPDASIGFQIEFVQLNVLKDDEVKEESLMLSEVCNPAEMQEIKSIDDKDKESDTQYAILMPRKKKIKRASDFSRKRSWVWKYFDKLSSIIYRCNLCNVVLSIKGCNTNNMNRHVRSRHPTIYKSELEEKKKICDLEIPSDVERVMMFKTEDFMSDKELDETTESIRKQRRSWIWSYFKRVSDTLAQCKLCYRNICHGGNATGNMNRHLKMIHHKTGDDTSWIWKVFDATNQDVYSCKICQYKCDRSDDMDKSINSILDHLRAEHGVISSEQIITGMEYDMEDNLDN